MNCPPDFDDDDEFFGRYDADRADAVLSLDFDDDDARPPTREQLAHLTRFRKPVAWIVAAMSLLSIVALAKRGPPAYEPERTLVAHYGSALPAKTAARAATAAPDAFPRADDRASSALVPEAWSTFVTEALSSFADDSSSSAHGGQPALAVRERGHEAQAAAPGEFTKLFSSGASEPEADSVRDFSAALASMCWVP